MPNWRDLVMNSHTAASNPDQRERELRCDGQAQFGTYRVNQVGTPSLAQIAISFFFVRCVEVFRYGYPPDRIAAIDSALEELIAAIHANTPLTRLISLMRVFDYEGRWSFYEDVPEPNFLLHVFDPVNRIGSVTLQLSGGVVYIRWNMRGAEDAVTIAHGWYEYANAFGATPMITSD